MQNLLLMNTNEDQEVLVIEFIRQWNDSEALLQKIINETLQKGYKLLQIIPRTNSGASYSRSLGNSGAYKYDLIFTKY